MSSANINFPDSIQKITALKRDFLGNNSVNLSDEITSSNKYLPK